jgi:hypothetical protein
MGVAVSAEWLEVPGAYLALPSSSIPALFSKGGVHFGLK